MNSKRFSNGPRLPVFLGLLAALLPAGCGWIEWPPPHLRQPLAQPAPQPASQSIPATPAPGKKTDDKTVKIQKGDTVYALSRKYGVGVREIITVNRLQPPYTLRTGQKILLPRPRFHEVESGETLYSISRRHGVDAYAFARSNGLKPPYKLQVGQRLRLSLPMTGREQISAPGTSSVAQSSVAQSSVAESSVVRKPITAAKVVIPASVPKPPPRTGKGFGWPVKGKLLSVYGSKTNGLRNDGINIAAPRGTPVRAAENGVVAYAGNELRGFGNLLLVKHADGWITAYAHNDELLVTRGKKVKKGQLIARVGSSGNVSTPQLHFELRRGKHAIDPQKYLKS